MPTARAALHILPETESDEAYSLLLDDCGASTISTLSSCSLKICPLKRTHKSLNLTSYYDNEVELPNSKRTRGASYNVVEIHSLLHLMKRVLPKSPDEWEIIRIVHGRIFPDNYRTISSLKKKFRDLCRPTPKPLYGKREVAKAREVELLISQKAPGFQLVLPKVPSNDCSGPDHLPRCSIPEFNVKVPNPLEPNPGNDENVPKFIQIPDSPFSENTRKLQEDEMSELELDEYEAGKNEVESVIINQESRVSSPLENNVDVPYTHESCDSKPPVVIIPK